MKQTTKKFFAGFAALSVLTVFMASCAEIGKKPADETTEQTAAVTAQYAADYLPDTKYNGYEFRMATRTEFDIAPTFEDCVDVVDEA